MVLGTVEITNILSEINSADEIARRSMELENHKIYEGELYKSVGARLKTLFPQTYSSYNVADYNIHKKIIDKKSKSYVRQPIRQLAETKENEFYTALLNDFNFNDTMKVIDRYKNQHKYCGLGIIRERQKIESGGFKDKFNFWALAPYEFCVHRDVNGNIYAWSLPTGKMGDFFVWTIWTVESHVKIMTKDYKTYISVPNEGNPGNINPYGVIPFIFVPVDVSGFYPLASSLPRQTVELNTNLSIYLTSANMQIGQLVLKHPAGAKISTVVTGLMSAIVLPQDTKSSIKTEADYISPSPNLAGHKESIITYMLMILDEHGINGSTVTKGGETFTSGFDRYISMADVTDLIDDNQEIYSRVENNVYNIIKAMCIKDGNFVLKSEKIKVKFSRPKILSSDSEKLDNLKKKKDLGLWEEWQLLQDADPNLTDDEAKKVIEERAARNPDSKNVFNGAQVTSLVAVVTAVAMNQIPRESGVQILMASFGIDQEQAERIIPNGFTPAALPGAQAVSSPVIEELEAEDQTEEA